MDRLDRLPLRHPAEFRPAVGARGVLRVHPEDAVPVRIERQRTAMRQNMAPQYCQLRPRRLGKGIAQRRQPARRTVNEYDQRAAGAAVLEPGVRAAVDLDQLAEARPSLAQLKDPLLPSLLRTPKAPGDLQLTHRLRRHHDPLPLQQLLHRKCGAEVGVFFAQQGRDPLPFAWRQPVVRWLAALA